MSAGTLWMKIRNAWSKVTAVILLLTAAAGILYEILHKIGFEQLTDKVANPGEVLIVLVSLLCGGLGAERLLVLGDIEESIKSADSERAQIKAKVEEIATELGVVEKAEVDIARHVSSLGKAELLISKDEIEAAACKLVDSCGDNERIRATSQYFPVIGTESHCGDPMSEVYFMTLAERLKRAKPGSSIEYQVVLPASLQGKAFMAESKRKIFETLGVSGRVATLYARASWPFELLIGGRSMIIAFPGGTNQPTYEMAILVTDDIFVKKANEWFLEVVRKEAQTQGPAASSAPGPRSKKV